MMALAHSAHKRIRTCRRVYTPVDLFDSLFARLRGDAADPACREGGGGDTADDAAATID